MDTFDGTINPALLQLEPSPVSWPHTTFPTRKVTDTMDTPTQDIIQNEEEEAYSPNVFFDELDNTEHNTEHGDLVWPF
jgi:hypothetical protein